METITNSPEGFTHLLTALMKARSVAAEGGYADLLAANKDLGLPGLDPFVGDDRTVDLIASFAHGERKCDKYTWLNITGLVERSPSWAICLAARGVEVPSREDVLAELAGV